MLCPSCSHDNLEGADRCEECMTPLRQLDVPRADDTEGLQRSVMQDNLSELGPPEVLWVGPETPAREVVRRMSDARTGCALILEEGKLLGIFTEHDVLSKMTGANARPGSVAVKALMSPNPETLRESDSVAAALNKMSVGRYRHVPVLRSDSSYSVISIKDLLKYIAEEDW